MPEYVSAVPGEDAVVIRPRDPYRLVREVFQVLMRYGGLSREARGHLAQAFKVSLDPALERRILAATSELWDGDAARDLADAIAESAFQKCPLRGCHLSVEHIGPCLGAYEPAPVSASDTGEMAVLP